MLYGNCKRVLKSINFLCANAEETTTLDIGIYLHNRIQTEDLIGCLHLLQEDGLIKVSSENGSLIQVSPTHKGKHFKENQAAEIKRFLFTSIVVPVIVSALTTIVSLWISGFFK